MIRLRTTKGKLLPLKTEVAFVEICDKDGNLALLLQQVTEDNLRIVYPKDIEFKNYIKAWGLKGTKIVSRG